MAEKGKIPTPLVESGQVWEDNDPCRRDEHRRVRVQKVEDGIVYGLLLSNDKPVKIRIDRMRPTSNGYRLVENADGSEPVEEETPEQEDSQDTDVLPAYGETTPVENADEAPPGEETDHSTEGTMGKKKSKRPAAKKAAPKKVPTKKAAPKRPPAEKKVRAKKEKEGPTVADLREESLKLKVPYFRYMTKAELVAANEAGREKDQTALDKVWKKTAARVKEFDSVKAGRKGKGKKGD